MFILNRTLENMKIMHIMQIITQLDGCGKLSVVSTDTFEVEHKHKFQREAFSFAHSSASKLNTDINSL